MTRQLRGSTEDRRHEARLRALGQLLDDLGYLEDGLVVLAVADGLEVTGLRRVPPPTSNRLRTALRREAPPARPAPEVAATAFTWGELDAVAAELRRRDAR
jgi:hypothetical protein